MNSIKSYWTEKRKESISTLIALVSVSISIWIPAIWYDKPMLALGAWVSCVGGVLGHALLMVLIHAGERKERCAKLGTKATAVVLWLALSSAPMTAQELPPPDDTVPFEFTVSLDISDPLEPGQPKPILLPAICVGVGVGVLGWVGIKIWSACLNIQARQATNPANAFVAMALDNAGSTQPVTGPECNCQTLPEGQPLPLRLEYSSDGQTWQSVSEGMTAGERLFVPQDGRWRIRPMPIIAGRDAMMVPPGTLETSTDLNTWSVLSVSTESRMVVPEPNHFYRIR